MLIFLGAFLIASKLWTIGMYLEEQSMQSFIILWGFSLVYLAFARVSNAEIFRRKIFRRETSKGPLSFSMGVSKLKMLLSTTGFYDKKLLL